MFSKKKYVLIDLSNHTHPRKVLGTVPIEKDGSFHLQLSETSLTLLYRCFMLRVYA